MKSSVVRDSGTDRDFTSNAGPAAAEDKKSDGAFSQVNRHQSGIGHNTEIESPPKIILLIQTHTHAQSPPSIHKNRQEETLGMSIKKTHHLNHQQPGDHPTEPPNYVARLSGSPLNGVIAARP